MSTSYWSRFTNERLSRRRALSVTSSAALGAAFLAACGGSDDPPVQEPQPGMPESPSPTPESSLLSAKEDTSDRARPGGVWVSHRAQNFQHIDPHTNSLGAAFGEITPIYSTPMKYDFAIGQIPDTVSGDAWESWEISPDGLRLTAKLRRNHKFDPRPPTNGRDMTVEDVRWSFERTTSVSPVAGDMYHGLSSAAPVESLTTPDSETIVVNLAFPYGAITEMLAYWFFYIMPVEADGQFDPRTAARGSGPWRLDDWIPDLGFDFSKNTDWYVPGRPFLDGINKRFLAEYTSALAQFEAGQLWDMNVQQEDVLRVKRDHARMRMLENSLRGSPGQWTLLFSQREGDPFRDVRLRRAASMLHDRELFVETFGNLKAFRDAGIPAEVFWPTHLPNQGVNWLNPKTDDYGEGGKYFEFDLDEARKLINAAGFSGPVNYTARSGFNEHYSQAMGGQMLEGFALNEMVMLEASEWRSVAKDSKGQGWDGLLFSTANSFNEIGMLLTKYVSEGKDAIADRPIPVITDLVLDAQAEFDSEKRGDMIRQIQRQLALDMPDVPIIGTQSFLGFSLHWPWLMNHGIYAMMGFSVNASSARVDTEAWYDESLHS